MVRLKGRVEYGIEKFSPLFSQTGTALRTLYVFSTYHIVRCDLSLPGTFRKKMDWESSVDLDRLKTNTQLLRACVMATSLGFPGPPSLYEMATCPYPIRSQSQHYM